VTCSSAATTCSPAPVHTLQFVQVNTSLVFTPLVHFPTFPTTITLYGQSIKRIGQ
jgi:hypothetical protein